MSKIQSTGSPPWPNFAALLVFLTCLAVYVCGLAPSPYWLDSSELAAASFTLGVAHPPGHPLMMLLGKACTLLPFGSIAFRAGLSAAFFGALAAALVTLLGARIAERIGEAFARRDDLIAALLGAAAGLGFGFSYAVLFQSVRPEVYTLHVALVLGAACALERFEATQAHRPLFLAALGIGLALSNHHFLTLLFVPAVIILLVWQRPARRTLLLAGGALGIGLLCYFYLPLRALRHPLVDWGAPSSPGRFFWLVSARAFQKSLAHAAGTPALDVIDAVIHQLRMFAPLALLGSYLLIRLGATRRLAVFLALAALFNIAAPALVGFDRANPDAYGYLETSIGIFAALATALPALLMLLRRRWLARLLVAALAGMLVLSAATGITSSFRTRFADTDRFANSLLAAAPSRSLVVTSQFQTVFSLWYAISVEGSRPDIDHLHRHFLAYPGYRDELALRRPALKPLLGAKDVRPAELLRASAQRPVLLEYDLDLDASLARSLVPQGYMDRLFAMPPFPLFLTVATREAAQRRTLAALDPAEPQTRRVLLWNAFLDAARDCRLQRDSASEAIARARALGGAGDTSLESLAAHCLPPAK